MHLFLASEPANESGLCSDNSFIENLSDRLPDSINMLYICSTENDYEINDKYAEIVKCVFESKFTVSGYNVLDGRTAVSADEYIADADLIYLTGGHVPTQNAFFRSISLKEKIAKYEGVIVGCSAGTMNCAGTVYAQPEEPGEAVDPDYQRFIPGLNLTEINVLPHLNKVRYQYVDGLRVIEDITLPDSEGKEFIALMDGAYILAENGVSTLFGEGYRVKDGEMSKICENGGKIRLK